MNEPRRWRSINETVGPFNNVWPPGREIESDSHPGPDWEPVNGAANALRKVHPSEREIDNRPPQAGMVMQRGAGGAGSKAQWVRPYAGQEA